MRKHSKGRHSIPKQRFRRAASSSRYTRISSLLSFTVGGRTRHVVLRPWFPHARCTKMLVWLLCFPGFISLLLRV